MKIFRGPSTKPFRDNTHELVSSISSEMLESCLRDSSYIQFNISKDAIERQAVCTARFDDDDIVPMISGIMSRLKAQQAAMLKIQLILVDQELSKDDKLDQIRNIVFSKNS